MESGSSSNTSNKQVHSQHQQQQQQHVQATSPKRSRSESKQDLASVAEIHARRRPSHVGRLHIDTQQPLPEHQQQALSTGPHTSKQTTTTTTSSTVDVTRRRQWSQTMLDVLQDLSLVLSPDGIIVWVPRTAKALLGYEPEKLVNERMADLIRPDEVAHFVHHLQESIDQQADFYHYYHIRKADGEYSCLEVSGRPHYEEVKDPASGDRMHASRCFFLSARPHPSRAAQALDTFFDIKKENEILRKKLMDLGVRQEELSEMGVLGETSLQTHSSGQSSAVGAAGGYEQGPEGASKRSSLQHWQQGSQRSLSPSARAQTMAPLDTTLAQTLEWQQQQQQQQPQHQHQQHQTPLLPHHQQQHQPNRDNPAGLDTFVNAFLSTEDLVNDMSHTEEQGLGTLRAPHNTASYFYAVGGQSPAIPNAARPLGGNVVGTDAGSVLQDPRYLPYSGLAQQQQQHVPPAHEFYPFGSPEPFPFGLYGATGYIESSPFIAPGALPRRRSPNPMQPQTSQQQQQQTPLGPPMSQASPRHPPAQLSHAAQTHGSPVGVGSQTPHMLPGSIRSSEKQARATNPSTVQATTPAQQPSPNYAHAKSPKKSKKLRAEGPEYVCTDCGTTDSPEWRRGPRGAKTLCNACGLRIAKLQKKASSAGGGQSASLNGSVQQMGMQPSTETRGHARHSSASTIGSK